MGNNVWGIADLIAPMVTWTDAIWLRIIDFRRDNN